eukprot:Clim_evm33s99 gene=Clim_evmTU33s99
MIAERRVLFDGFIPFRKQDTTDPQPDWSTLTGWYVDKKTRRITARILIRHVALVTAIGIRGDSASRLQFEGCQFFLDISGFHGTAASEQAEAEVFDADQEASLATTVPSFGGVTWSKQSTLPVPGFEEDKGLVFHVAGAGKLIDICFSLPEDLGAIDERRVSSWCVVLDGFPAYALPPSREHIQLLNVTRAFQLDLVQHHKKFEAVKAKEEKVKGVTEQQPNLTLSESPHLAVTLLLSAQSLLGARKYRQAIEFLRTYIAAVESDPLLIESGGSPSSDRYGSPEFRPEDDSELEKGINEDFSRHGSDPYRTAQQRKRTSGKSSKRNSYLNDRQHSPLTLPSGSWPGRNVLGPQSSRSSGSMQPASVHSLSGLRWKPPAWSSGAYSFFETQSVPNAKAARRAQRGSRGTPPEVEEKDRSNIETVKEAHENLIRQPAMGPCNTAMAKWREMMRPVDSGVGEGTNCLREQRVNQRPPNGENHTAEQSWSASSNGLKWSEGEYWSPYQHNIISVEEPRVDTVRAEGTKIGRPDIASTSVEPDEHAAGIVEFIEDLEEPDACMSEHGIWFGEMLLPTADHARLIVADAHFRRGADHHWLSVLLEAAGRPPHLRAHLPHANDGRIGDAVDEVLHHGIVGQEPLRPEDLREVTICLGGALCAAIDHPYEVIRTASLHCLEHLLQLYPSAVGMLASPMVLSLAKAAPPVRLARGMIIQNGHLTSRSNGNGNGPPRPNRSKAGRAVRGSLGPLGSPREQVVDVNEPLRGSGAGEALQLHISDGMPSHSSEQGGQLKQGLGLHDEVLAEEGMEDHVGRTGILHSRLSRMNRDNSLTWQAFAELRTTSMYTVLQHNRQFASMLELLPSLNPEIMQSLFGALIQLLVHPPIPDYAPVAAVYSRTKWVAKENDHEEEAAMIEDFLWGLGSGYETYFEGYDGVVREARDLSAQAMSSIQKACLKAARMVMMGRRGFQTVDDADASQNWTRTQRLVRQNHIFFPTIQMLDALFDIHEVVLGGRDTDKVKFVRGAPDLGMEFLQSLLQYLAGDEITTAPATSRGGLRSESGIIGSFSNRSSSFSINSAAFGFGMLNDGTTTAERFRQHSMATRQIIAVLHRMQRNSRGWPNGACHSTLEWALRRLQRLGNFSPLSPCASSYELLLNFVFLSAVEAKHIPRTSKARRTCQRLVASVCKLLLDRVILLWRPDLDPDGEAAQEFVRVWTDFCIVTEQIPLEQRVAVDSLLERIVSLASGLVDGGDVGVSFFASVNLLLQPSLAYDVNLATELENLLSKLISRAIDRTDGHAAQHCALAISVIRMLKYPLSKTVLFQLFDSIPVLLRMRDRVAPFFSTNFLNGTSGSGATAEEDALTIMRSLCSVYATMCVSTRPDGNEELNNRFIVAPKRCRLKDQGSPGSEPHCLYQGVFLEFSTWWEATWQKLHLEDTSRSHSHKNMAERTQFTGDYTESGVDIDAYYVHSAALHFVEIWSGLAGGVPLVSQVPPKHGLGTPTKSELETSSKGSSEEDWQLVFENFLMSQQDDVVEQGGDHMDLDLALQHHVAWDILAQCTSTCSPLLRILSNGSGNDEEITMANLCFRTFQDRIFHLIIGWVRQELQGIGAAIALLQEHGIAIEGVNAGPRVSLYGASPDNSLEPGSLLSPPHIGMTIIPRCAMLTVLYDPFIKSLALMRMDADGRSECLHALITTATYAASILPSGHPGLLSIRNLAIDVSTQQLLRPHARPSPFRSIETKVAILLSMGIKTLCDGQALALLREQQCGRPGARGKYVADSSRTDVIRRTWQALDCALCLMNQRMIVGLRLTALWCMARLLSVIPLVLDSSEMSMTGISVSEETSMSKNGYSNLLATAREAWQCLRGIATDPSHVFRRFARQVVALTCPGSLGDGLLHAELEEFLLNPWLVSNRARNLLLQPMQQGTGSNPLVSHNENSVVSAVQRLFRYHAMQFDACHPLRTEDVFPYLWAMRSTPPQDEGASHGPSRGSYGAGASSHSNARGTPHQSQSLPIPQHSSHLMRRIIDGSKAMDPKGSLMPPLVSGNPTSAPGGVVTLASSSVEREPSPPGARGPGSGLEAAMGVSALRDSLNIAMPPPPGTTDPELAVSIDDVDSEEDVVDPTEVMVDEIDVTPPTALRMSAEEEADELAALEATEALEIGDNNTIGPKKQRDPSPDPPQDRQHGENPNAAVGEPAATEPDEPKQTSASTTPVVAVEDSRQSPPEVPQSVAAVDLGTTAQTVPLGGLRGNRRPHRPATGAVGDRGARPGGPGRSQSATAALESFYNDLGADQDDEVEYLYIRDELDRLADEEDDDSVDT